MIRGEMAFITVAKKRKYEGYEYASYPPKAALLSAKISIKNRACEPIRTQVDKGATPAAIIRFED